MTRKAPAKWTIMVYMAGDNNLSEECVYNLTEMKKANCGDQINIIAEFDPNDDFLPTRRYEINKGGVDGRLEDDSIDDAAFNPRTKEVHFARESKNADLLAADRFEKRAERVKLQNATVKRGAEINSDTLSDLNRGSLDDTDMASRITLYNFLSFCIQEYPAEHYLVILSGHGAGTERDYFMKDESSSGYLTFNEFKQVFQTLQSADLEGKPLDILGLDSCLMSMAEVCYELRGLVKTVVGCESYAPAAGWPYLPILERLKRIVQEEEKHDDLPQHFAKGIVEDYVSSYADYAEGGMSVTQSALDVTQVSELKTVIKKFADTLKRELAKESKEENAKQEDQAKLFPLRDALVLAHWEAQSYNGESYVDVVDFCQCLRRRQSSEVVDSVCEKVIAFITKNFVLRSCFSGPLYQYSNGVSIYFPWSAVAPFYVNIDFAATAGWAEFLASYTDLTRRAPRQPAVATPETFKAFLAVREVNAMLSSNDIKVASGRMGSGRMGSGRMGSGRMGSGRMGSGRMGSGRMGSGREGNPIHSMRNPPIVSPPFDCESN